MLHHFIILKSFYKLYIVRLERFLKIRLLLLSLLEFIAVFALQVPYLGVKLTIMQSLNPN